MSNVPRTRTSTLARTAVRRRRARWLVAILAVLVVLAAGLPTARWYIAKRSLSWQAGRGLELLAEADSPAKVRAALDLWEQETRANWEPRREEFIAHLYSDLPLEDQRARLLLTRVAGADFGARSEDWQDWFDTRQRLRQGLMPLVARRDTVRLEPRWTAAVGLTAWFTTILPLDGHVYVASLGTGFSDAQDEADGVVRVDGASGASELFFVPPPAHLGPRDVVGLAAGDDSLFVACLNGSVYYVALDGAVRWTTHVGDPIVAPPLAVDTNRDGVLDVLVATRAAKVIALSGRGGNTSWVAALASAAQPEAALGTTLALGDVLDGPGHELLVATPAGCLAVLSVRDGQVLRRRVLETGSVAGTIGVAAGTSAGAAAATGPAAFVGDRAANVWSLLAGSAGLETLLSWPLATSRVETLVAAPRTLDLNRSGSAEGEPLLLACLTGEYGTRQAALCALEPTGTRWRLPLAATVWATPAVADLNGNGHSEAVVASIEPHADGYLVGVVTIISWRGRVLRRETVGAPIECSPVVADVDGDSHLDLLVADQLGRLHCLATTGFGPIEWGSLGGDSHNTRNAANAYAFGQIPVGYQWRWRPAD